MPRLASNTSGCCDRVTSSPCASSRARPGTNMVRVAASSGSGAHVLEFLRDQVPVIRSTTVVVTTEVKIDPAAGKLERAALRAPPRHPARRRLRLRHIRLPPIRAAADLNR